MMRPRPYPNATNPHWRRRALALVGALLALCGSSGAAEALTFAGEITNTSHDVTAPLRLQVHVDGDTLRGSLSTEPPLLAGQWDLSGERRGAWWEFVIHQVDGTATVLRGVLDSDGRLRGTFVFGGSGQMVQYGRFDVRASSAPAHP